MNTKTGNRILSLLLAVVMTVCTILPVIADDVIIDWVLYTNVRTFINGVEISSFNIKGYTAVVVEDLAEYGFDVVWDGDTATLSAARNFNKAVTGAAVETVKGGEPGERAMPVYATNIKTYFDGQLFESYNVGGRTIVYMDALAEKYAADYVWDGATSKLSAEWKSGTQQKMVTDKGTVTVEDAKGNYNLTELGTTDWFIPLKYSVGENGNLELTANMKWLAETYSVNTKNGFALESSLGKLSMQFLNSQTDARTSSASGPMSFSFTDGLYFKNGELKMASGTDEKGGWEIIPKNAKVGALATPCGYEIRVTTCERSQTLTVFVGALDATAQLTVSAGNEVIGSDSFTAEKAGAYKKVSVTVAPNTSITIRAELTSLSKKTGSLSLEAYALTRNESNEELGTISALIEKARDQAKKIEELNDLIDQNGTLYSASGENNNYYYYRLPPYSQNDIVYTIGWQHYLKNNETYLVIYQSDPDGVSTTVVWLEFTCDSLDPLTFKWEHYVEYRDIEGSHYYTYINDDFPYSSSPDNSIVNPAPDDFVLKNGNGNTADRESCADAFSMLTLAMSYVNQVFKYLNWNLTFEDFGFTNHN